MNNDGTLDSWSRTTDMNYPRAYISPISLNGYVYVFGGYDGTTSYNKVDYAPFTTSGTLGEWRSSGSFSTARYGQQVDAYNGVAYLTGGYSGTYLNTVQYAGIQSAARMSTYSKLFDLGALYNVTGVGYGGVLPGGTGSIAYQQAGSDGILGTRYYANSLTGSSSNTCIAGNTRYMFVIVTINDSTRATLPDEDSSNSYISHLAVNYAQAHADTDKRLAHGKYFEYETLQPLDTCST